MVSKDEDFRFHAKRAADAGQRLWIRLGDRLESTLLAAVERSIDTVLNAFAAGQRIVEVS